MGGARGSLLASIIGGDLHVKAIPRADWELTSASGNIRVDFPPAAHFEVDATTNSGAVTIDHDDLQTPQAGIHHFQRKVNGGGARIQVRTGSGNIVIR